MSKHIRGTYLLAIIVLIYLLLLIFNFDKAEHALYLSLTIVVKILPIIAIVIVLLGVFNYFFSAKKLSNMLGKSSGVKAWFIALIGGLISHGPPYVWYPMLSDLRSHGVREGLIVTFLYARIIKLPMLPIMIDYFGWIFSSILIFYILLASIIQGIITDLLYKRF